MAAWSPLGGFSPFLNGAVSQKLIWYAASARNIVIEQAGTHGFGGQTFYYLVHDGRRVLFHRHVPQTTSVAGKAVCREKDITKLYLERSRITTPKGSVFRRTKIEEAWKYACTLGLPVVTKPISGSGGEGVTARILDKRHFELA